jgi:ankyrin repeat protein
MLALPRSLSALVLLSTLPLWSTAAQAQPADLCAPLLAERVRIDDALNAVAAGADPNQRCERTITVRVGPRFSLGEVVLGVLIPPVGAMMLLGAKSHPETRVRHPAPLDLAVAARATDLTDALLVAGADPLLPSPPGEGVPLETAIALDMTLGGTGWSTRLLRHADRVPPNLLERKSAAFDALLDEPALLRTLLERGLDTEGRDTAGMTWMTRAIRDRDMARLRAALAVGADPNLRIRGMTPINRAVTEGSLEALQILVEGGGRPLDAAGDGTSLLTRAVDADSPAMISAVLAAGVPVDGSDGQGQSPLEAAVEGASTEIVEMLLTAGAPASGTEAHAATKRGDIDLLRAVLAAGADPNHAETFGRRPLHQAITETRTDLVQVLLDAGADPTMPDTTIFHAGAPIDQVFEAGDADMLALLLPHVRPEERSPLLVQALGHEQWAQAALLVDADTGREGADTRLDAALGRLTFPDQASARAWLRERGARFPADSVAEIVRWGDAATLTMALGDGADVNTPGPYADALPADLAVERGDPDLFALLLAHEAHVSESFRLSTLIRDRAPSRVRMALELRATVRADDIREAVRSGDVDSLRLMAAADSGLSHRAWDPGNVGYGASAEMQATLEEIYGTKRAEAKAARQARKDAKRAARRARRRH